MKESQHGLYLKINSKHKEEYLHELYLRVSSKHKRKCNTIDLDARKRRSGQIISLIIFYFVCSSQTLCFEII